MINEILTGEDFSEGDPMIAEFLHFCTMPVCAWCVPVESQKKIQATGIVLSHGICKKCSDDFRARLTP